MLLIYRFFLVETSVICYLLGVTNAYETRLENWRLLFFRKSSRLKLTSVISFPHAFSGGFSVPYRRISEEITRKEMIDPQLEKAGWYLRDHAKVRIEIPVDGYNAEP